MTLSIVVGERKQTRECRAGADRASGGDHRILFAVGRVERRRLARHPALLIGLAGNVSVEVYHTRVSQTVPSTDLTILIGARHRPLPAVEPGEANVILYSERILDNLRWSPCGTGARRFRRAADVDLDDPNGGRCSPEGSVECR